MKFSRRARGWGVGTVILLVALTLSACAQQISGRSGGSIAALVRGEWPAYAGTYASTRYSPLDQINAGNVANLAIAWRWMSPDHAVRAANAGIDPSAVHQGTPIMVNGVLYTSTWLSRLNSVSRCGSSVPDRTRQRGSVGEQISLGTNTKASLVRIPRP
jgi:glucose dehydrogenase